MTQTELLRILNFADQMRHLAEKRTYLSSVDARWNIMIYAIRRHFEGKRLTLTSLAAAADVPYGTAMRRITELIDAEFLIKRPSSKTGKSFSLHPSRKLILEFESYAQQLKSHIGKTFGFNAGDDSLEDFYFGASHMAARTLSYPSPMRSGIGYDRVLRILSPVDPTFKSLSDFSHNLREFCGTNLEIVNLPLDDLHEEIINNHQRAESRYDLIAVDLPWIGEFVEKQMILPLNDMIDSRHYNYADFHNAAWKGSSYNGDQYGIPIQPTAELLFYREDLFRQAGLKQPKTLDDVLVAAKTLHKIEPNTHGIVMNYGPGTPVAHTFMQIMASFGQPVINLPRVNDSFDTNNLQREHLRPMVDSESGYRTAEFLLELLDYAHPQSLSCNWDKRIKLFAAGEAAMTYGWSIRAAVFELDEDCVAHGKVNYVGHPHGPGAAPISPVGGFSLAIPAGLSADRVENAWKTMEYLTRPELIKWYVQNGNFSSPRFSTSADPEVKAISKIISQVDSLERQGQLQSWGRPPIPEFFAMLSVLGEEIYGILDRSSSIDAALKRAQGRIEEILAA